jgi:hypothetical protein
MALRALLLLATITAGTAEAMASRAGELARIHTEAIGGRQRIEALAALRATGHVSTGGKRLQFTMIAARPDRIRLETEGGGRTLLQGSDGVEPPWEFDTGTWPPRYRAMAEANIRTFTADAEYDDPLVAGPARGFAFEDAGEAEVDGRRLLRLVVTRTDSETFQLLLDPETYLILLRVERRKAPGGKSLLMVTRFDDFRPVDGVLLPHQVTLMIDGKVVQTTTIERIEANPPLGEETFRWPKPAAK